MREGWAAVRRGVRDGERGASLVEFALVVPLLCLFLFGIVQFGIAYDKQQSVNSAAREGARLGALKTTKIGEIETRASKAYGASASDASPLTVSVFGGKNAQPGPPAAPETLTPFPPTPPSGPSGPGPSVPGPCGSTTIDFDFVRVEVTTPYEITIPFFGVMTVDINSEGEFRCE